MTAIPIESFNQFDQKVVREELDRILKSTPFAQSRRRQRFLEYIVNEALAGRGQRIKGYTIAREVFDRSEEFDPNVDPIVRMEAARLRDRLRESYEEDGRNDPVRIELPKGTYTPQIEFRRDVGTPPSDPDRVPAESAATVKDESPLRPHLWWKRWQIAAPVAALVMLVVAAGMWFAASSGQPEPKEPAEAQRNLPPAVAVLPFVNLGGDPKQDYFSDGITEDILTELSRARDLRVLARNTTFQYKGKAVDVGEIGRELGVPYVLEGSIRRSGDRFRGPSSSIQRPALISGRIATTARWPMRGVALAEKANALNPDAATGWYHSTVYTADYLKGDYEHALKVARQNQDAEMFYSYLEIIPIFGQLGLQHEALDAWKKLQAQLPDASAKTFEEWWRLWNGGLGRATGPQLLANST